MLSVMLVSLKTNWHLVLIEQRALPMFSNHIRPQISDFNGERDEMTYERKAAVCTPANLRLIDVDEYPWMT